MDPVNRLDPEFLDILACPRCRGGLAQAEDDPHLVCAACRVRYRVEDGIPILLPDEAEALP